ncbi:acyl-coenzyme A thioesterase 2, mitochondrial-like [Limanda limanda]|uniref:acyl-coenzyme A thioesterase 2, mitochondrial-like n=1 Tax=Limanda limanda TaxID=27771 RepID=UPI0029C9A671|nr:acyl-coenzyme A thioesterase 2, mitochondrial-like [Limanda limanda]
MLRLCASVTTIQHLMGIKIRPCFSLHRKLTRSHRAVGAVRWMSSCRPAPVLTAAPVRALIDEQIRIKGHLLPPSSPVTVCARMHSDDGDLWEAFAHYNTNADGTVNLTRDNSVGGSYLGCEPMGKFESFMSTCCSFHRLREKNVETPYLYHISVLDGHVSPSEAQGAELAAVTAERWYMAPGVRRIEIRQNALVGTLFLPPGPGPFPAMLDLWGMGGGLVEYRSALFASRGYASFSLAYIGHKELPGPRNCLNVDDSYFKSAFHLLQDHHQICADRVGVIGLSYGGYQTLRIATQTGVKPSCLICINGPVGSFIRIPDADGRTESPESEPTYWTLTDQGFLTFNEVSLPANVYPGSIVKIENLNCPLMNIEGEDDLNMASRENANLADIFFHHICYNCP